VRDSEFYSEIAHIAFRRDGMDLPVPAFYYDTRSFGGYWSAPTERVKALLPSDRMHPYRLSPGRAMVGITAYEYRDCDIGPYNEVSIGIPFTLDVLSPLFTGTLRRPKGIPKTYTLHLPVTTEAARYAGVEFYGYPKFLAEIGFEEQGQWLACRLAVDGHEILTLKGRQIPLVQTPRTRVHPFTSRGGRLLRCEFILNVRQAGASRGGADVRLELGSHEISDQLRALGLGNALAYHYCPQYQGILTPVLESHSA
jgi:hypothetical protein